MNRDEFMYVNNLNDFSKPTNEMKYLRKHYNQDKRILMILYDYMYYFYMYYSDEANIGDKPKHRYMSLKLMNLFGAQNYSIFKTKMKRFENKYLYGLLPIKDLMDFYADHYQCFVKSVSEFKCSQFGKTIEMLSPLGKCHTYLSSTYANQTLVTSIDILFDTLSSIDDIHRNRRFPHYLDKYVYIHDKNSIGSIDSHLIQTDNIGQLDELYLLAVILKKVKTRHVL